MNELLDARYDELIHRVVWGIELFDAVRDVPTAGATVRLEPPAPRLPRLDDHGNGRFSLTFRPGLPATLKWRVDAPAGRFVPRRFAVDLATEAGLDVPPLDNDLDLRLLRTGRRLMLFPGATYPVPTGATTLRGRVLRGGTPMRWARVAVELPALTAGVLARAQSDAHGEFHAVIGPVPGAFVLPATTTVELTVHATDPVPDRSVLDPDHRDPCWDLPVEPLPDSGVAGVLPIDDVAAGVNPPSGYRASAGGVDTHTIRLGAVNPLPATIFT